MKAAPFRIIRLASRMLLNRLRILLLTTLSIIIRLFCRGKKLLSRHKKI